MDAGDREEGARGKKPKSSFKPGWYLSHKILWKYYFYAKKPLWKFTCRELYKNKGFWDYLTLIFYEFNCVWIWSNQRTKRYILRLKVRKSLGFQKEKNSSFRATTLIPFNL